MNGLEEKTRHATKSEIDDLLAELGYQGAPVPKPTQTAPVHKPTASEKPAPTAESRLISTPRPAKKTAPVKAEEPPRRRVRETAEPVRPKQEIRRGQSTVTKPKSEPLVMQFPPTEPEEAPLLDIPIDIPRRAPKKKKPVPEGRLLRHLREALDENVEEIEMLTALPTADGTVSLTFAQRAKKLFYFLIGFLCVTAALIGFVTIGNLAWGGIRDFASGSDHRTEFQELLEPLVLMDIQMFESVDTLESDQILSAAVWDIIMHSDLGKYEQTMGVATIPAVDVEHSAAQLFGTGLTFRHGTIGTGDLQFYYNEDLKSYHVPAAPSFFSYTPVIESVEKNGAFYTLRVKYEAETPSWQQEVVGLESEKTVLFVVEESENGFCVRSAENITASVNE